MLVFGIPLGSASGIFSGNLSFVGIGIPIGLTIGIAVGTSLDTKAKDEGRQLDLEVQS